LRHPVLGTNPPDTAVLCADSPIDFISHLLRHIARVIDELAVEIRHVKRAIRTGGEIDRMKPGIGGSEELLAFFAATGLIGRALGHEDPTVNEISQRFADEEVAPISLIQNVAAINGSSRRRVEVGLGFVVEHLWRRRERENPAVIAWRLKVLRRLRSTEERNAIEVAALDHHMPEWHSVPGEEAMASVVERRAKLAAARDRFELARGGPESKIAATKTVRAG